MADKKIYDDFPEGIENKQIILGSKHGHLTNNTQNANYQNKRVSDYNDSNNNYNNKMTASVINNKKDDDDVRNTYNKKIFTNNNNVNKNHRSDVDFDAIYRNHMGLKSTADTDSIGSDNPEDYNFTILDQNGKKIDKGVKCTNENKGCISNWRKPRKPLCEHPLNTTYNEDFADIASKGLMLGGSLIVANGIKDALGPKYGPIATGATLVGAGVLIYKLTDQDIKKFYRNYVSRLEGDYSNLISYNDYAQFVKKYKFKYEEDYYKLNDILAGKDDPIDINKFIELNRYAVPDKNNILEKIGR